MATVSQERMEKSLEYLVTTDNECAVLRADCERLEFKAKRTKAAVFKLSEGTVAELLVQAIPLIQALRDGVFTGFQIDGEIAEPDIRKEVRGYDRWLKKAKQYE